MLVGWDPAGDAEELEDIVELAMEVATDCDGGRYRLDIRLYDLG